MSELDIELTIERAKEAVVNKNHSGLQYIVAKQSERIDELVAQLKWLDNNSIFMEVDHSLIDDTDTPINVLVLACVSKRIWYHATDDIVNGPFSAVIEAGIKRDQEIESSDEIIVPDGIDVMVEMDELPDYLGALKDQDETT